MTSAVLAILAGGFSRRYQEINVKWKDKALTKFEGVPLLVNLVKRAVACYDTIYISVNSDDRKEDYLKVFHQFEPSLKPIFVVDSENTEIQGVLRGITSILTKYKEKEIQFIATDFPFIDFKVLENIKTENGGVGILDYSSGMIEPLLTRYGSQRYFPKQFQNLSLSRADVIIRMSSHLNIYNIEEILEMNKLSPGVFDNINFQSESNNVNYVHNENKSIVMPEPREIRRFDLRKLNFSQESVNYTNLINEIIDKKQFYAAFLWSRYFFQNDIISSKDHQNFGKTALKEESKLWLDESLPFLALHALQDLVQHFPEEENEKISNEISSLRKKMSIEPRRIN